MKSAGSSIECAYCGRNLLTDKRMAYVETRPAVRISRSAAVTHSSMQSLVCEDCHHRLPVDR